MVAAAQNREVDLQEDRQEEKQRELAAGAAAAGQTMVIRPPVPVLLIFAALTRGTTRRAEQHRSWKVVVPPRCLLPSLAQ